MEFTASFWLILALTLVLGWVLGLMSRSGGGRWKRELKTEREAHVVALRDRDERLTAANARISDLERSRPASYRDDGGAIHDTRAPRSSAVDDLDLRSRDSHRDSNIVDAQGRPIRP